MPVIGRRRRGHRAEGRAVWWRGPAAVRRVAAALVTTTVAALGVALTWGGTSAQAVPTLPPGFTRQGIPSGLGQYDLVNFVFLPGGEILAVGKCGAVRRVGPDGGSVAVATLPVYCTGDRGLLGVDLAPDFATSRTLYTLYTYRRADGRAWARLSSWQADDAERPTALTGERVILDDLPSWSSTGASCDDSHTIGSVVAAPDGTLYVGNGDASSYCSVDQSALAAADPDSPRGKILRITPDGAGVPGNPFYSAAQPASWRSRTLVQGLRNPFRFSLQPQTNALYVGDVGWNDFEEVNVSAVGGADFGWPCWEGASTHRNSYAPQAACQQRYATVTPTAPLWAWPHAGQSSSSVGGVHYTGTSYPIEYQGAYFFGDYARNRIWTLLTDGQQRLVRAPETNGFGADIGAPVAFRTGPNGDVYYADISSSTIFRLRYQPGNRAPVAVIDTDRTAGAGDLTVAFGAGRSYDLDGEPLTYSWDFGDGVTATGAEVSHTYAAGGAYTARLTVTDGLGATATATVRITTDNQAPELLVGGLDPQATFAVGDPVRLTLTATDPEDGALPDSAITVRSLLQHCPLPGDCHVHPGPIEGERRVPGGWEVVVPDHGDDTTMEATVTVTDSRGATTSRQLIFPPRRRTLAVTSAPPGVPIAVNDADTTTATAFAVVEGSRNVMVAPLESGGARFVGWNDGVTSPTREVVMPAADVRLVARYSSLPVARASADPTGGPAPLTVTFTGTGSSDPDGDTLSYLWDFGDGSPAATEAAPRHTYREPGRYTARLTVTDPWGLTSTATVPVTVTPGPAGLVSAWGFDEGSGTVAVDLVGGRPGTVSGATRVPGRAGGGALSFDGNDVVRVPDSPALRGAGGLTVTAWVRPGTSGWGYRPLVAKRNGFASSWQLSSAEFFGRPYAAIDTTSGARSITAGTRLPTGTWSHIAMTYGDGALRIYVDGVQVAARAQSTPIRPGTGELTIGADGWGAFVGLLDDVRVYGRALTAAEVREVRNTSALL